MNATNASEYKVEVRRGIWVVMESRAGREIGCYGFPGPAEAIEYERRMRGEAAKRAEDAARPVAGETVLYRSKAGAERPYRVLRAYTQRRRVVQGPNGMSHFADCLMVDLEAAWADRGFFSVVARLVRRPPAS
jgi:hypothetical protein